MKKWLLTGVVCFLMVFYGTVGECFAEEVERQVILEGVESGAGVPEEILVEYEGKEEYVPVKSARVLREYWSKNFTFPVLFYVYDAEYYELGECRIPRQEDEPGLDGYEGELLKALGLDETDYVIEQAAWNGDAYQNEEGIWCRDATASGRKRVRDYEVVYGKEIEGGREPIVQETAKMQEMADTPERVERVVDSETAEKEDKAGLWSLVKRVTIVTIAAELLLMMLLLLLLLFLRLAGWHRDRKREKDRENEKIYLTIADDKPIIRN